MSDLQSQKTPKLTPARREALERAAKAQGYSPYGAEWRTARLLLSAGLIRPRFPHSFRNFRVTSRGQAMLDAH